MVPGVTREAVGVGRVGVAWGTRGGANWITDSCGTCDWGDGAKYVMLIEVSSFQISGSPDLLSSAVMGSSGGEWLVNKGRRETGGLVRGEMGGGRRCGGGDWVQLWLPWTIHRISQIFLPQPQLIQAAPPHANTHIE